MPQPGWRVHRAIQIHCRRPYNNRYFASKEVLVPHRLVDNITQRFACDCRGDVVNNYLQVTLRCLRGIPLDRDMRGHQKVGCVPSTLAVQASGPNH